MKTTLQNIGYSKNLAGLFYAIAATDKRVHETEIRSLKKLIRTAWPKLLEPKNNEQFDQIYQIELEFDRLVNENSDVKTCFDAFVNFKKENQKLFTDEIKELIWETANSIALSFSGKNKSELILLTKLKMNLLQ
jgi:hypothetical protein